MASAVFRPLRRRGELVGYERARDEGVQACGFEREVLSGMKRVVVDTNVLVGSAYNPRSASRRIVDACLEGRLKLIVSPAIRGEYREILPRAIRKRREAERLDTLIAEAAIVEPAEQPRVVREDPEDDKFVAAAVAGNADAIITNDEHLLALGSWAGVPIMRPSEFMEQQEN